MAVLGVDGQFPSLWSFLAAPPAPPGHQVRVRPAPGRAVTYAARGQDLLQQPVEVLLLGAEVALVLRKIALVSASPSPIIKHKYLRRHIQSFPTPPRPSFHIFIEGYREGGFSLPM